MTIRGLIVRIALVAFLAGLIGSLTDSWGWALFLALLPIAYHEMLRPR